MTLEELIDRAVSIATAGLPPEQLSAFAGPVVSEDLLITIFGVVADRLARERDTRTMLRRSLTLTFTNGSATLPQTVLTNYLCESFLYDPNNITLTYSWQSSREVFINDYDDHFGRYHVDGSTVEVIEAGDTYSPGDGKDGDLTWVGPTSIPIPTVVTDPIDARDEVVEEILNALVSALRPAPAPAPTRRR